MRVRINGDVVQVAPGTTLGEARDAHRPGSDLVYVNGMAAAADRPLEEGDEVFFFSRGVRPASCELAEAITARSGPGVHERLRQGSVGIAGCGGLGSNVAVALARSGIGRLVLADFDVVEPTNLNRQHFFVEHVGMPKAEALASMIARIHPGTRVETFVERVRPGGLERLFGLCDVVAECFDGAEGKAALVSAVRTELPGVPLVTVSGIAGHGDANAIVTRTVMTGVHLVGDMTSDVASGMGIMAPRVLVAAGHQANRIVQILMGEIGSEVTR